ncbi:MAG: hypothetical protein JO132_12115 [Streptosporangiaceae bacterium]|nr:hypothetical protein [Streptosporangiaceae bacterium]
MEVFELVRAAPGENADRVPEHAPADAERLDRRHWDDEIQNGRCCADLEISQADVAISPTDETAPRVPAAAAIASRPPSHPVDTAVIQVPFSRSLAASVRSASS